MNAPTTADEWWELVDNQWEFLLEIFGQFLPMYKEAPESLYTEVSPTNPKVANTAWDDVENCKAKRNHEKLRQYLFACWESAPDNSSIHSIPGWGSLCDLLSESWVFENQNPENSLSESNS